MPAAVFDTQSLSSEGYCWATSGRVQCYSTAGGRSVEHCGFPILPVQNIEQAVARGRALGAAAVAWRGGRHRRGALCLLAKSLH